MFCLKITILNSVELQVCDSLKEARKNLNKKLDQMQRPLHMVSSMRH